MTRELTPNDVASAYALLAVLPFARPIDPALLAALVKTYRAAEVSGSQLHEAASWAAQTQASWPAPAVLIQRVRTQHARNQGHPDETAEEAWGHVRRVMQSGWHGTGLPPHLSARARGAFAAACNPEWSIFWSTALTSEMVSHRSRFVDAYRAGATLDSALLAHEARKRQELIPGFAGAPRALPYDSSNDWKVGL